MYPKGLDHLYFNLFLKKINKSSLAALKLHSFIYLLFCSASGDFEGANLPPAASCQTGSSGSSAQVGSQYHRYYYEHKHKQAVSVEKSELQQTDRALWVM